MIHPKEIRRDSLRTTKNVLESLNQMLSIETNSSSEKQSQLSSSKKRTSASNTRDNQSFFTQYFNRLVSSTISEALLPVSYSQT